MIQDYVIAEIQWGFLLALLPTLFHKSNKPTFTSAIWTGTLLIVFSVTLSTIELWNGAMSALLVSGVWFIMAYQRYRINKRKGAPLVDIPKWILRISQK